VLVRHLEGGFGIGGREDFAVEVGLGKPFADRLANGAFIIDDQDGVLHSEIIIDK
jgi:hypothetical protein